MSSVPTAAPFDVRVRVDETAASVLGVVAVHLPIALALAALARNPVMLSRCFAADRILIWCVLVALAEFALRRPDAPARRGIALALAVPAGLVAPSPLASAFSSYEPWLIVPDVLVFGIVVGGGLLLAGPLRRALPTRAVRMLAAAALAVTVWLALADRGVLPPGA